MSHMHTQRVSGSFRLPLLVIKYAFLVSLLRGMALASVFIAYLCLLIFLSLYKHVTHTTFGTTSLYDLVQLVNMI